MKKLYLWRDDRHICEDHTSEAQIYCALQRLRLTQYIGICLPALHTITALTNRNNTSGLQLGDLQETDSL